MSLVAVSFLILHDVEESYILLHPLHVLISLPFSLHFLSKSMLQIASEFILLLGGNPSSPWQVDELHPCPQGQAPCTRDSSSFSSRQAINLYSMSVYNLRSLSSALFLFANILLTFFLESARLYSVHSRRPTSCPCVRSPVLNIGRCGRDIGRYLILCLLPIRYGEIVRPYRLQQKTTDI